MNEIEKHILCLFVDIVKELEDYYIFRKKKRVKDYLLEVIYKLWGKHIKINIFNYNYLAHSFNKVFFGKNLLKSLIFFDKFYDLIGEKILDVGCGAAPVSIAINELVKNRKGNSISISLIDKSKKQLSTALDLAQIMSMNISSYTENVFDIKCEKHSEFVVLSYFICEQKKDFVETIFNYRDNFSGGFAVIDYKDNIMRIEKYFKDNGDDNIDSVFFEYSIPENLSQYIHDKEVNVYGCVYRP